MFCKKCGNEVANGQLTCPHCGAALGEDVQLQFQPQAPAKVKNPVYKKWWFWVIIVFAVIIISISNSDKTEDDQDEIVSGVQTTSAAEETTVARVENEVTEKEFKASCESIDYKTLSRNPDKYKGNNYKLKGEVIQVQESSFGWNKTVELRINVTKETFEYSDDVMWTDTIYATVEIPDGADRILEEDIVTFWGVCDGLYTYKSVLGASVSLPKIDIKYYEIN